MTTTYFMTTAGLPGTTGIRPDGKADLLVPTTTLLPSGAVVMARIKPLPDGRFVVSDDGGAIDEVSTQLFATPSKRELRKGEEIARRLGLHFDALGFRTEGVTESQLQAAIIYVAEAARQWATQLIEAGQRRQVRDLAARVEERLRLVFPEKAISREREVQGLSSRSYQFDLVADLGEDRLALFELVSPHPNAIAAAHLKFFDVSGSHPNWPREAVVERLNDWPSADLAVLGKVASHVRDMGSDWNDLELLAA